MYVDAAQFCSAVFRIFFLSLPEKYFNENYMY